MSLVLAVVVVMVALAATAPVAGATKYFDSFFGSTGLTLGGTFNQPRGVAVNDPSVADGNSVDGWIYVVDSSNNRIQAFDGTGTFQWAIGKDVRGVNEVQTVSRNGATGGTYTLSFDGLTTAPIAVDATSTAVRDALEDLSTIGEGNVTVSGFGSGLRTVTFIAALAGTDVSELTGDGTSLTGGSPANTVTVTTTTQGAGGNDTGFEKCAVASQCKRGETGTTTDGPGGEFATALGIAIDQETGHFFVRERNNNRRVQEFEADGDFVRAFGWNVVQEGTSGDTAADEFETCFVATECQAAAAGGGDGQFGSSSTDSTGIAIAPPGAPNAGELFVADPGNRRVQRFTVPASPAVPVTPGTPIGSSVEFDSNHPRHLAVGTDGILYGTTVGSGGANRPITRYDTTTGTFLSLIDSSVLASPTVGVTIDPSNGHLLVVGTRSSGILELDLAGKPATVEPSHVVDAHVVGLAILPFVQGVQGLGINPTTGEYFLSTTESAGAAGTGHRIVVLDDSGVDPPPTVELLPPTDPDCTTATFNATVNPNGPTGFPTAYRFEVSKDGIEWTAATSDESVGDGSSPVTVQDEVTGLEANTFYRVRLVTTRSPAAGVTISPELTFLTDPCPPTAQTDGAQHVSDTSAQLVGRVNPSGLSTDYWFEWGDDAYGNVIPVPAGDAGSGSVERVVAETLTGLEPESFHHFRLCAQNSLAPEPVCGADRTFMTRAAIDPPEGRGYEMVTSPDKALRRGGERFGSEDHGLLQPPIISADGDSALWAIFAGVTDPEAGSAFVFDRAWEARRRTAGGWRGEAVLNVPTAVPATHSNSALMGVSADLSVQRWWHATPLWSSRNQNSTRVMGDTGGPLDAGWYPWLDSAWMTPDSEGPSPFVGMVALLDDEGERLVGLAPDREPRHRDVIPVDDTVAPQELSPAQTDGQALFLSTPEVDWRPGDLINECTGAAPDGDETLIPARDDEGTVTGGPTAFSTSVTVTAGSNLVTVNATPTGTFTVGQLIRNDIQAGANFPAGTTITAVGSGTFTVSANATGSETSGIIAQQNLAAVNDDTIDIRPCGAGSPTDVRGATLGSRAAGDQLGGTLTMSMSDDGERVFFMSPDGAVAGSSCASGDTATGAGTRCPAQLFVRQYDDEGNPTVRWISRAEDALFDAPQQIDLLGNGASFEGASRDGSVVYFRTNAPLTTDDPNGGAIPPPAGGVTTGAASPISWDLYRYESPGDNEADPAGGTLTRVSGGPDGADGDAVPGDFDPNTNCALGADCGEAANGGGGVARFVSDDGERVYFVTAGPVGDPIDDWNVAPSGGTTTPGGAPTSTVTRNLYLYDAGESGSDAYRFIARIPHSTSGDLDACASSLSDDLGEPRRVEQPSGLVGLGLSGNCVHGTASGDAIVFETTAQLTADDTDAAGDVYLYDAETDELVRLSAPPPEASPYVCLTDGEAVPLARCNGDLGFGDFNNDGGGRPGLAGLRHWNVAEDADGRLESVFFESRLALTEDASGHEAMKVYEWRRGNGRLSLVSPAGAQDSAFYTGNSRDGEDVFFWTQQQIDPREIDVNDGDVYDARVGGGFPAPPPPPAVCAILLDACQGAGGVRIDAPVETATPGGGNVSAGERPELTVGGLSRRARTRAARRGVVPLKVRSTAPAVVRAVARARVAGKVRTVARASKRLARAGEAVVRLRLNRAARRRLRSGKALGLEIVVRSAGMHERAMNFTLRRGSRR